MESYFKEYDKRHWGVIDIRDFKSTLNLLNLQIQSHEMAVITKKFAVPGPEMTYSRFIDYCSSLCDMKAPLPSTTTNVY